MLGGRPNGPYPVPRELATVLTAQASAQSLPRCGCVLLVYINQLDGGCWLSQRLSPSFSRLSALGAHNLTRILQAEGAQDWEEPPGRGRPHSPHIGAIDAFPVLEALGLLRAPAPPIPRMPLVVPAVLSHLGC